MDYLNRKRIIKKLVNKEGIKRENIRKRGNPKKERM